MVYNLTMATIFRFLKPVILLVLCLIFSNGCSAILNPLDIQEDSQSLISCGEYKKALSLLKKKDKKIADSDPDRIADYPSSSQISEPEQNPEYYAYDFDNEGNMITCVSYKKSGLFNIPVGIAAYYPDGNVKYKISVSNKGELNYKEYYDEEKQYHFDDEIFDGYHRFYFPAGTAAIIEIDELSALKYERSRFEMYTEEKSYEEGMIKEIKIQGIKNDLNTVFKAEEQNGICSICYDQWKINAKDPWLEENYYRDGYLICKKHSDLKCDENSYVISYEYDKNGMLEKVIKSDHDKEICAYFLFDEDGKLLYQKEGQQEADFVYCDNKISKIEYANGRTNEFTYDEFGRLVGIKVIGENGIAYSRLEINYDKYGRKMTETISGTTRIYDYDWQADHMNP